MKSFKIIILLILALSFKQVKSQCLDSLKVATASTDSMTFNIYLNSNNDTVNLVIYNRWGQLVKKVFNDSIMQAGFYVITYHPSSLIAGAYFYMFTSHGGCKHNGTVTYLGSSTGINQISNNNFYFTLYPNPTNSTVNIEFQSKKETQVVICDMMSRVVYTKNCNENSGKYCLDISNLSSGIYMVNLVTDKMKVCQKLIKN